MDRKLLPYEHQLIDALGITKEEYLAFVAVQQEYADNKVGTALDIRNTGTEVAIVLTVVGILFQVGAALLAPKPKIPELEGPGGQNRSREARFAPTFGFNSAQELASYGDPVNLVYTNTAQNANGGVRLSGSLVWSAIESFGSDQVMLLLFVMGAARIQKVEANLTAFGQAPIHDFDPALFWLFYRANGSAKLSDAIFGKTDYIPYRLREGGGEVCRVLQNRYKNRSAREIGFSQCYTPSTSSVFGIYDPMPINVRMFVRDDDDGGPIDQPNKVTLSPGAANADNWQGDANRTFAVGEKVTLNLQKVQSSYDDDDPEDVVNRQADNLRRQYMENIGYGTVYKLGTAKFILHSHSDLDIDKKNVGFTFECIEGGREPSVFPGSDDLFDLQKTELRPAELQRALNQLKATTAKDTGSGFTVTKSSFTSEDQITTTLANIVINQNNYNSSQWGFTVDFTGYITVKWNDKVGFTHTTYVNRAGSLAETEALREELTSTNPPILPDTDNDRKRNLRNDKRDLRELISIIESGGCDDRGDNDDALPFKTAQARALADAVQKQLDTGRSKSLRDAILEDEQDVTRRILEKQGSAARNIQVGIASKRDRLANAEKNSRERGRRSFLKEHYYSDKPFIGIDGKEYPAGFEVIKAALKDDVQFNKLFADETGVKALRKACNEIIKEKKEAIEGLTKAIDNFYKRLKGLKQTEENPSFFTKCLVKSETASYETTSPCDVVRFTIKARLFRRIAGRQRIYGQDRVMEGYSAGDNGIRNRVAYFRFYYKTVNQANYERMPVLLAVRRGSESDAYLGLYFEPKNGKTGKNNRTRWQFKFEPVHDPMAHFNETTDSTVGFIEGTGSYQVIKDTIGGSFGGTTGSQLGFYGRVVTGLARGGLEGMPKADPEDTFEYDLFSNNTDTQVQFSFENGPEFSISAVNEQQFAGTDSEDGIGAQYDNLSTMAMVVRAGKNLQDLRKVTTFVSEGKDCYNVDTLSQAGESSSYAPDIFMDTAIDTVDGVGNYVPSIDSVLDIDALRLAKKFCKNNQLPKQEGSGKIELFMDGIIADATSWREFWVNNAPFSLLELVRKNGKEALLPAIPVNSDGRATVKDSSKASGVAPIPVPITALFTSGNILEGSYKEEFLDYGQETQPLIATIVYREMEIPDDETNEGSVFAKLNTVEVQRKEKAAYPVPENEKSRETFDASAFVTQREQAIMVGKLLVNQRMWIERGIEFKTFPSDSPVEPGSYIYVDVGNKFWDNTTAGKILEGKKLNSPLHEAESIANGTYNFLVYNHGAGDSVSSVEDSSLANVQVTNMTAPSLPDKYIGYMFVMGKLRTEQRVFRVTEVALEEEGEVRVKAVEYPCNDDLSAKIADFEPDKFTVR